MYAKDAWHASPVLRGLTDDKTLDWSGYTDSFRPDWKEVLQNGLHDLPTIKEWVEKTADRVIELLASTNSDVLSTDVAALKAARSCSVAEMGVGKGMIIFRLMPFCERVVVGDTSEEALPYVEKTATELGLLDGGEGQKNACRLELTKSGDAVEGLADIDVDAAPVHCVVCNGVALYFDSVQYTLDFLATAAAKVTKGLSGPAGTVFLGDVRTAEQAKYFDVQKMVRVAADKADLQAQKDTELAIAAGISLGRVDVEGRHAAPLPPSSTTSLWSFFADSCRGLLSSCCLSRTAGDKCEQTSAPPEIAKPMAEIDGRISMEGRNCLIPLWKKDMREEVEAVRKQLLTEKYFRKKYVKWSHRRGLIGAEKDRLFDFRGFYRSAMRDTRMGGLGDVGVIETRLKPGKIRSEFSNYRYDVILHRFPDGYLESVDGRVEKLPEIVTKGFHEGLDLELIQNMVKVGSLIKIAIWRRWQV